MTSLAQFEDWCRMPGPGSATFDFPVRPAAVFSRRQRARQHLREVMRRACARGPDRMAWVRTSTPGATRGEGTACRTARATGSAVLPTSALQTRYVPVGLMYYEGMQRLLASGVTIAGLHAGDPARVALEAYPRRLAHSLIEWRSYKNQDLPDRAAARESIVRALERADGSEGTFALAIDEPALRASLVGEASGDRLDAVLCLVQAARASRCPPRLPEAIDPVEGWIPNA